MYFIDLALLQSLCYLSERPCHVFKYLFCVSVVVSGCVETACCVYTR